MLSPKFPSFSKLSLIEEEIPLNSNNAFKDSLFSFKNFNSVNLTLSSDHDYNQSRLVLSGQLFGNQNLIIEQKGLQHGLRNKCNGISYFGFNNTKDLNDVYFNDYILITKQKTPFQESLSGRVFSISYNEAQNKYHLNFYYRNISLYYQIEQFIYFEIGKPYVFSIGSVIVNLQVFLNHLKQVLKIEVEYENSSFKSFSFSEEEAPITIGRKASTINIPMNKISKKHAIIQFSKETNLFYFRDLQSSNGSLLILKEDDSMPLKGLMKFKLNDTPFTIMDIF